MKREGLLYIVSAPSGAGKTSLCKEVVDILPNLRHSVSHTTRTARPGEIHGVDYFFVSPGEFLRMVDAGEFAEWAHVHGNMYGTAIKTLEEFRHDGVDVILDIDCQGALKLKERFGCGVYIFILPPDLQELRRRLNQRNSETPETIERRLEAATDEIRESRWYDYIIVNVLFQQAADELKSVLLAEHCRTGRVLKAVSEIFDIQ